MYKIILFLSLFLIVSCTSNQPLTSLENNELQPINNKVLKKEIINNIKTNIKINKR